MKKTATFSFHVINLGCRVNRVESDTITALLISLGGSAVALELADIVAVNTCAVTAEAEKKTRKTVRQALARAPFAHLFVTGCSVALNEGVYTAMGNRVHVAEKFAIEDALKAFVSAHFEAVNAVQKQVRVGALYRSRSGIKIQDGCNNACTYCVVHIARGPAYSVPSEQIIAEAQNLLQAGARELVLTGINLGTYFDASLPGTGKLDALLTCLLKEINTIHEQTGEYARIRLSSIEPMDVSEELIALLACSQGVICRHLHLPLQSGSTKVLKEMNRPYTAEQYCALVDNIKRAIPEIALTTDCIVGFPGERESDFRESCDVISYCGMSKVHVFPYSIRANTPAALRTDQIDAKIKQERARVLRLLSAKLQSRDLALRSGREEWAFVESDTTLVTESFHSISVDESRIAAILTHNNYEASSVLPHNKLLRIQM